MSKSMLAKSAFDTNHVKSVKVWALVHNITKSRNGVDLPAGRIVASYSDNPMGSVCTVTLHFFSGPLSIMPTTSGKAGGYGYDKFSAAVADALDRAYGLDAEYAFKREPEVFVHSYFTKDEVPAWKALQSRKLNRADCKDGGWSNMHGRGGSAVREMLQAHGYTVLEVV